MHTADRGLFDVERFDSEPGRELFHGLLGELDPAELTSLSTADKAPYVMRILEAPDLSARMAASMVEIDRTISTWPQLSGDVQLGAVTVAAAVRRFGRGDDLPSGRIRVDVESCLDRLAGHPPSGASLPGNHFPATDLTQQIAPSSTDDIVRAIRLAPSGGNSQPWSVSVTADAVAIRLVRAPTSAMDVGFRGSQVAIGAAGFNARVAASRHGVHGPVTEFPDGVGGDVVVSIALAAGSDRQLADEYPSMIDRITNRNIGRRAPLPDGLIADLHRAAEAEGASLNLVVQPARLALLAAVLAESDRVRYLTPLLHEQLMAELKWPGVDRLDQGIDVRTLGADAGELAKLRVAGRADVMAHLSTWGGGSALGDGTRDRVEACSALAVIVVDGDAPRDYLHGGAAAARVWLRAARAELGVQPVSPVFLYARSHQERTGLSAEFGAELAGLQGRFDRLVGLRTGQVPALVLRLSHDAGTPVRSQRLPLAAIITAAEPTAPSPTAPSPTAPQSPAGVAGSSAGAQRVDPADTGKAGEVGVCGVDDQPVLHRQRGELGIGHQIAGDGHLPRQLAIGPCRLPPGRRNPHRLGGQPALDDVPGG
jgi:nitroreductase